MVRTLKIFEIPGGVTPKAPMWTFDVNYVTQNNIYVQFLATICVFQQSLRRQMSTVRFVKPAVARDFYGANMSLPLALFCPKLDWVLQRVSNKLLSLTPCNAGQLG